MAELDQVARKDIMNKIIIFYNHVSQKSSANSKPLSETGYNTIKKIDVNI